MYTRESARRDSDSTRFVAGTGATLSAIVVTLMASGCTVGDGPEEPARAVSPFAIVNEFFVDTVSTENRRQVADVIDVGPIEYVVGHITPENELRYSRYSTSIGPLTGPSTEGSDASWIRANTSRALTWSNCDGNGKTGSKNYFAVQMEGEKVFLDGHERCLSQWTFGFTEIDTGTVPSVATRGNAASGSALVVYGQSSQLRGRFLSWNEFGSRLGTPFPISVLDSGPRATVFSTDVIYNAHSGKYIVGFIDRSDGSDCKIKNVTLTEGATPVIGTRRQFGFCDSQIGGHHTSVAYNPLSDGTYVWWRQDALGQKAVYVHGSQGELTSFTPFLTGKSNPFPASDGSAWTQPVTSTANAATPYMLFGVSNTDLFGFNSDKTWGVVDDLNIENGSIAVRALASETVGLTRRPGPNLTTSDLMLSLSDKP